MPRPGATARPRWAVMVLENPGHHGRRVDAAACNTVVRVRLTNWGSIWLPGS